MKQKLSEIADITMGQSPLSGCYNSDGIGAPFLQGCTTFGRIHPSYDTWTTQFNKSANKDDVLFTVRAPVGDVNLCQRFTAIGRGLASIHATKVSPKYLFYLLEGNKSAFISESSGTIYQSINKDKLCNIVLNVHDSSTQQHIVDTIGSIDELIENYDNQAHIICSLLKAELKKFSTVIPFSFYSPRIIKSGIKTFDTTKIYLDTSSVEGVNEIFEGEAITFCRRPSRANMQPIANSVWFAKMKASNKIIVVSEKDTDLITGTIFSTGFLGIEATKKLPLSLLTAFLISDSFHVKRDMCSVGTTMASINNDSFLRITVPYLNSKEIDLFESKYKYPVQTLCLLRRKIAHLKQAKADLLAKYF